MKQRNILDLPSPEMHSRQLRNMGITNSFVLNCILTSYVYKTFSPSSFTLNQMIANHLFKLYACTSYNQY